MAIRIFTLVLIALFTTPILKAEIPYPPFPTSTASAEASKVRVGEIYDQLKLYRNYYRLDSVEAPLHHFWIEFQLERPAYEGNSGPVQSFRVRVSVLNLDEIKALTPALIQKTMQPIFNSPMGMSEDVPGAWNETLIEVPSAFSEWSDEISKKILETEADAKSIHVQYGGSFGKVRMSELIPGTVPGAAPFGRVGILGEMKFRVSENLGELTQVGFPSLTYGELLPLFGGNPVSAPQFIDFEIDPALSGKSLTRSYQGKVAPLGENPVPAIFEGERLRLEAAILKAASAVIKGNYVDPLSSVLARQSSGILPNDFDPYMTFNLDLTAKVAAYSSTKEAQLPVRFRVRDAMSAGGARVETIWKLAGEEYRFLSILRLSEDGKGSSLTLLAMHPDDGTCDANGVPVETKSLNFGFDTTIYRHDGWVAMPFQQDIFLPSSVPQEQTVRLPGIDKYLSVDVYVLGALKFDVQLR